MPYEQVGTTIHNVELYPGRGGQLARSAGVGAVLVSKGVTLIFVLVRSYECMNCLTCERNNAFYCSLHLSE